MRTSPGTRWPSLSFTKPCTATSRTEAVAASRSTSEWCRQSVNEMRNPGKEGFFVASDLNGFYNRRNGPAGERSEEHTSELQSRLHLVCRLLLEKKKNNTTITMSLHRNDYSDHI